MNNSKTKPASTQNWLVITFLFVPFFATTLKNTGNILAGKGLGSTIDNFLEIIQLKNTLNDGIIIFGFAFLIRILLFLAPFLLVTIIELKNKKFKDTTIGKLKYSKGHKFADIWYFAFQILIRSFQQIAVFTTVGLTIFYSSFQDFFHNIYNQILPQNTWVKKIN